MSPHQLSVDEAVDTIRGDNLKLDHEPVQNPNSGFWEVFFLDSGGKKVDSCEYDSKAEAFAFISGVANALEA